MRIIAGEYKHRVLKTPGKNDKVRPTTDRARETLFNILNNFFEFEGTAVVDLFCGTGSFGIECLSRGAELAIFVDKDVRLIEANAASLKTEESSEIIRGDALIFLRDESMNIDLIFADPPYDYIFYNKLLEKASKINSYFILEHSDNYKISEEFLPYMFRQKEVGMAIFSFFDFRKPSEAL
ncbi:MAG: RsmD family RNA methyltransferase [Ignavibacteria bacterium]|nr:RsmD family RNA methyltransferase [Ignavibacteria bacterium]